MDSQIPVNELAKACAHSADAVEWSEFLRRTTPLASLVAVRVARLWMTPPTPALVADIVQEVYLKFCERDRHILREFQPRGDDSFLGLLRIVSASVANDYFRRLRSAKRGGRILTSLVDAELVSGYVNGEAEPAGLNRTVLMAQLDRKMCSAGGAVSARDRTLFWLYYEQGFTAEQIAALPSIALTVKGVESALRRVALWLRSEVEGRNHEERPREIAPLVSLPKGALAANPLNRE